MLPSIFLPSKQPNETDIFALLQKRKQRLVKVREFSRRQPWKERPCIWAQGCVTWVGALCTMQSEESGVEDQGAWRCAGITTCCTPAISGTRASIHTRDWVPASGPPGTHSSLSAGDGQTEAWRGKDVFQDCSLSWHIFLVLGVLDNPC